MVGLLDSPPLGQFVLQKLAYATVSFLGEQLQQKQDDEIASWIHTTEQYDRLFDQHEYAKRARKQTGGDVKMSGSNFVGLSFHRHSTIGPM